MLNFLELNRLFPRIWQRSRKDVACLISTTIPLLCHSVKCQTDARGCVCFETPSLFLFVFLNITIRVLLFFLTPQGIFLVYDITSERSFQHIMKWASDVDEVSLDAFREDAGAALARSACSVFVLTSSFRPCCRPLHELIFLLLATFSWSLDDAASS